MSDTDTDTTPDERTDLDNDADDHPHGGSGGRRIRRYANYAVLLVLGVLAFVAVIRLYLSVSSAITTWITDEYRSLFQAAFNLLVLLAAGLGISYQLRRLYG